MKLRPTKIHFSQELLFHYSSKLSTNNLCPINSSNVNNNNNTNNNNNNNSIYPNNCLPKLQVFKKGDCYFALDNNCLTFYRRLELTGHLGDQSTVEADVVATRKIPKNIYDTSECSSADDTSLSESQSSDDDSESISDDVDGSPGNKKPSTSTINSKLGKLHQLWSAKIS